MIKKLYVKKIEPWTLADIFSEREPQLIDPNTVFSEKNINKIVSHTEIKLNYKIPRSEEIIVESTIFTFGEEILIYLFNKWIGYGIVEIPPHLITKPLQTKDDIINIIEKNIDFISKNINR